MTHENRRIPPPTLWWLGPVVLLCAGCGWYPVIDAGLDQEVAERAAVQLTAINRSAAVISAYVWEQVEGPAVMILNADSKSANFVAPYVDEETTLAFQVTAFAALVSVELPVLGGELPLEVPNTDITRVTVMPNPAPLVDAGADMTVISGTPVQLAGDAFIDADIELATQWVQIDGPSVHLTNPRSLQTTFDAPLVASNSAVVLLFELTAEAEPGNMAGDTVSVVVAASEAAAAALPGPNPGGGAAGE